MADINSTFTGHSGDSLDDTNRFPIVRTSLFDSLRRLVPSRGRPQGTQSADPSFGGCTQRIDMWSDEID